MGKKIFIALISFLFGIVSAFGVLWIIPQLSLFDNQPIIQSIGVQKPQIIGFLPYWLLNKAKASYASQITTLTYFGFSLNHDGSVIKLTNPQEQDPGWNKIDSQDFTDRQNDAKKNREKQSLLVVSGDDSAISDMLMDPQTSAANLMNDVTPIMKEKGFTDLNLDIESFMPASESGRSKFTQFVQSVKDQLVAQHLGTLTVDLIPIALVKSTLYDAKAIGTIADSIVLMTYDYHYSGSYTSGAVAPIGGVGLTLEYDVETAVKEALKVMPKEKILLGIPLYGYEWETISDATESATIPGGSSTASVSRVAQMLADCTNCVRGIDPISKEPYMVSPEGDYFNQIYYEDEASMGEKIKLAQKYNLGGVALWALGYEDDMMLRPLAAYKNSITLSW